MLFGWEKGIGKCQKCCQEAKRSFDWSLWRFIQNWSIQRIWNGQSYRKNWKSWNKKGKAFRRMKSRIFLFVAWNLFPRKRNFGMLERKRKRKQKIKQFIWEWLRSKKAKEKRNQWKVKRLDVTTKVIWIIKMVKFLINCNQRQEVVNLSVSKELGSNSQ